MARTLKQKLAQREPVKGLFCCSYSPQAVEALGDMGWDFLLFDNEHTPNQAINLHHQLCALKGTGTEPVLRLPMVDEFVIKSALDLGVKALMLPNVNTAQDVERLVRHAFYPPIGRRGIGGTMRATRYGKDKAYLSEANQDICLLVQIESVQAVQGLDAILDASDRIDGIFLGPHDLAADMGLIGQPTHPQVVQRCVQAIERAQARGVPAGILCAPHDIPVFRAAGASVFVLGSDLGLMVQGASQCLSGFQQFLEQKD